MSIGNNFKDIERRKGDHIRLCLDLRSQGSQAAQASGSVFDGYRLPYTALPEASLDDVDTSVSLCDKTLAVPLIIGSMTGGSEHGRAINTNLALAAEQCGVAMGVGSQRIGLEKQDAADTFTLVRKHAPNAFIVASGGVRSPLDGLKSRALGADLFSAASPFLEPAITSAESVIAVIENWKRGLRIAMFAAGVKDWNEAKKLEVGQPVSSITTALNQTIRPRFSL